MNYTITRADIKRDKDQIIALWKRNFTDIPEERYEWIYENNPAGSAICLIAKDPIGSIIGAASIFPRKLFLDNHFILAGIAGDFVIDKEHRGFGPAIALQKAIISKAREEGFEILYGIPNNKSEAVLLRVGYRKLGNIIRMTKPLKSEYYIKRYINIPGITHIISKVTDFALKPSIGKKSYLKSDYFKSKIISSIDKNFDEFWEVAKVQWHFIGVRDSSYLKWRFFKSPNNNHQFFVLSENDNGKIVGYILYHIANNKIYIDDILAFKECYDFLISEFICFQNRRNFDSISISFLEDAFLLGKFKQFGFSERDRDNKVIIYQLDKKPQVHYRDQKSWFLTPCDNDI